MNSGNARWQAGRISVGQLILDSNNNIELALTAGSTGTAAPTTWNQQPGQITNDGGVTWTNLGHATWQASTSYASGQAILDPAGNIQFAQVGGKSGANQPTWTETRNAIILDAHSHVAQQRALGLAAEHGLHSRAVCSRLKRLHASGQDRRDLSVVGAQLE